MRIKRLRPPTPKQKVLDFDLIESIVEELMEEYPKQIRLRHIGVALVHEGLNSTENITKIKHVLQKRGARVS